MSYDYRLMFLPSIRSDSYLLVTSRGDSVAVRHYASPTQKPTLDRTRTLTGIGREPKRPGAPEIVEEPHSTEDLKHWWRRTEAANRRAGLGAGGIASPVEASTRTGVPPRPGRPARFVDHQGNVLAALADWQALHPAIHWKAGYSAMELARSWHSAQGFPAAVANAVQAEPFGGLVLDRAIAECRTAVPGAGRPSHTDLMVEATDRVGGRVVVAVEGKVRESFGPLVGAWLREVENGRSAANKLDRLRGLCDGLALDADRGVEGLRYQLLHRTWAALSHARSVGAPRAIVLVHSFARPPDQDNRAAFSAFVVAMGQTAFAPGLVVPLGPRMGVELWTAWVSDAPVPG